MVLIEVTTVPDTALPVDDFKAHLRLGSGFGADTLQDEVLKSFLRASMAAIEARTQKALIERNFSYSVTRWSASDAQGLPVAPVAVVTGIDVVARDGMRTPVASDAFWLEKDPACPRVRAVGTALPSLPSGSTAEIAFIAGYGPAFADVPADLRQAVLLLAAHYYEFRHETGLSEGCMPFGVTSLIERYKVMRTFAGGAG